MDQSITSNDLKIIQSKEDVFLMLDEILQKRDAVWWNTFYSDKNKPIPFFKCIPDENLHSYVERAIFHKGTVLDIGCGNGRNAIYLAKCGLQVDAIDFSETSIAWAKENAKNEQVTVNFICASIFHYHWVPCSYDFIYDSGCLHHIPPHRRNHYLDIISNVVKPNGYVGLSCFNPKGGANISDYDVYKDGSMHGGMGYSEYKLKTVLNDYFDIIEFREMKKYEDNALFGTDSLWAVLMRKKDLAHF